jgi:hypothetical protein
VTDIYPTNALADYYFLPSALQQLVGELYLAALLTWSILPRRKSASSLLLMIILFPTMDNQLTPKVPIPHLPGRALHSKRSKQRVDRTCSVACNNCRRRKIRCNGAKPQCNNCTADNASCVYAQARRDRLKEYVLSASLC